MSSGSRDQLSTNHSSPGDLLEQLLDLDWVLVQVLDDHLQHEALGAADVQPAQVVAVAPPRHHVPVEEEDTHCSYSV